MPNIFIMATVANIPYNRIKKSKQDVIREIGPSGTDSSRGPIGRLVNEFQTSSKSVSIPDNFTFLKTLSDRYADTLRGMMSSSSG